MSSSDPSYERREEQIFFEATALPLEEREPYLDLACDGDVQLRSNVERLLLAVDDHGFMERVAADVFTPDVDIEPTVGAAEQSGEKIGNYRLVERIGEGGFGVIWIAQQEEPVRREVALKIVKIGMDTKDVIARFDQERKALAMMEHPNIAKALDAGTTRTGRPFFVMELVRGVKVTEYCDRENVPTLDRLKLFIRICNAVQHAHQKGVIHRDLKPSNVLVELVDGTPTPKVIDFGVAKATRRQRFTDLTVYTSCEQVIGTPLYMSPEQAAMSGTDIDTRSDIYSLGVLLYELLVGRPPFDAALLSEAGFDEMRRVIREREPQRPSTSIQTLTPDARITGARLRSTDPSRWVGHLRGDLDCIVMKALEKDRSRRYDSASDFAHDLERHLKSEPVVARPPTTSYRFRRFARRNRVVVTAGSAVFVAILVGLGVSSWMFWKEKDARQRAVAAEGAQKDARLSAEKAAAKSRQIAQFLTEMLNGINASVALGRDTTLLREILDKTAERVGKDLKAQPEVEADLREVISNAYYEIGDLSKAEEMIRQAIALLRRISDVDSEELSSVLHSLGLVLEAQGRSEEAEPLHRDALGMLRRLPGDHDASVGKVLGSLGNAVESNGRWGEAERLYRKALAIERKAGGGGPVELSDAFLNLAGMISQTGKLAEAEGMYREALRTAEETLPEQHPTRLALLSRLAFVLGSEQRWEEAEKINSEAFARIRRLYGDDSLDAASAKSRRAEILLNQNRLAEAEVLYRESLDQFRRHFGSAHPEIPRALVGLADVLGRSGNLPAADQTIREAVEIQRQLKGSDHPRTARYLSEFGEILAKAGKLTEAESIEREALEILRKVLAGDHCETASVAAKLADVLRRSGKYEEAETFYKEAIEIFGRLFGPEHTIVAVNESHLAGVYHRQGALSEAEKLHRHALEIYRKARPENARSLPNLMLNLAFELTSQKKFAEAEPLYREALALRKRLLPIEHPEINASYRALYFQLIRRSKFSEAEQLGRDALESRKQCLGDGHSDVGEWFLQLGDLMVKEDRVAEAEPYHRMALAIARNDPTMRASRIEERIHRIADDLYRQRKYSEAEQLYRQEINSQRTRSAKEEDQKVIGAVASLARLLAEWAMDDVQSSPAATAIAVAPTKAVAEFRTPIERALEAERLLRTCLEIEAKAKRPDDWRQDEIRNRHGLALMAVALADSALTADGRKSGLAEAESSLLESQRALESNARSERKYQRHALLRLIQLYQHLDRPSELKMWQQKLAEFDERGSEFIAAEEAPTAATE